MQSAKSQPLTEPALMQDPEIISECSDLSETASVSVSVRGNQPRRALSQRIKVGRKVERVHVAGRVRKKSGGLSTEYRTPTRIQAGTPTNITAEKKTQLVLAGQPTGWTAMAQAVRNFDEEKVKDCKEDVDTLLVFAGLFSAVLTAFLIESYNNLLEDPATQTLAAIRQLVAQTSSYSFDAGMLNSTVPSLTPEVFQASSVDIRVNVLWFASLLFSLITASFSILVKQWLREFLTAENPSPQARLRVRHLRYPQLSRWKVFEIAAALPLLLQLALALFFIGLCYFTASVHSSVGYTTLPLVIGWTVCFCTVTILPLVYPRCPYRTALLRPGAHALHRRIGRAAKGIATSCQATLSRSTSSGTSLKQRLLTRAERLSQKLSTSLADQDEARIMRRTEKDVEILGTVDSIQSDDELLSTAIAEAVDHLKCEPTQFEAFLRTILENRGHPSPPLTDVPHETGVRPLKPFALPILNLRLVSKQTRNAIYTIVSRYAENTRFNIGPVILSAWSIDQRVYKTMLMCMIMLAVSDCPCPEDGLYIIKGPHFEVHGCRVMRSLIRNALDAAAAKYDFLDTGHNISEDKAILLLRGLGKLWDHLDVGTDCLLNVVVSTIAHYGEVDSMGKPSLPFIGCTDPDGWTLDHLTPRVKANLMGLLVVGTASILRKNHGTFIGDAFNIPAVLRGILRLSYSGREWSGYAYDALSFDFMLSALLARRDFALIFVDALLQTPLSWLCVFIKRFPDRLATVEPPTYGIDMYAFDWNTRLDNFAAAVATRFAETDADKRVSNNDAFKLCYFASSLARFLFIVQLPRSKWASLFGTLLDRVDSPTEESRTLLDDSKSSVADHMLTMMHSADERNLVWTLTKDGDEEAYRDWVNSRREENCIFPDRLFESIAPYSSTIRQFGPWGVRRALEAVQMKAAEKLRVLAAGPVNKPTLR